MNLILFGFKGCGKTHFGKQLAEKMKRPFFDTDEIISARFSLPCRDLYRKIGEEAFRLLEREAIRSLIHVQNAIIAVGGGAVLDPENVKILRRMGRLVYLEVNLETVKKRVVDFAVGPLDEVYRQRKPIYESISAHRICVDREDAMAQLEEYVV